MNRELQVAIKRKKGKNWKEMGELQVHLRSGLKTDHLRSGLKTDRRNCMNGNGTRNHNG